MKWISYVCLLLFVCTLACCSKEVPEVIKPVEPPTSPEPSLELLKIEIIQQPEQLVYPVGYDGEVNLSGLQVEGTYSDGSKQLLVVTASDVFGFSAKEEKKDLPVKIRLSEKEAVFYVQIVSRVLTKVEDNGASGYHVPEYIREIGVEAFVGTHYKEVLLNEGLEKIAEGAFRQTPVEKINFPSTLKGIGKLAFVGCAKLKEADLSHTQLKILEEDVLRSSGVERVDLPEKLEEIGDMAFANTPALKSIAIPACVKKIGFQAFRGSGVLFVEWPENVQLVGNQVFMLCGNLEKVTCVAGGTEYTNGVIGSGVFEGCTQLKELQYPASIREIGNVQFSSRPSPSQLERLMLGKHITKIGFSAFANLGLIQSMEIQSETPPSLDIYSLPKVAKIGEIKVPGESLMRYQTETAWSTYKDIMKGM